MTAGHAPTRYRTIVADPPWQERGGGQIKRGAGRVVDCYICGKRIILKPEQARQSMTGWRHGSCSDPESES